MPGLTRAIFFFLPCEIIHELTCSCILIQSNSFYRSWIGVITHSPCEIQYLALKAAEIYWGGEIGGVGRKHRLWILSLL